ncbi:MAG: hypothetical protein HYZ53_23285 [Planctomycetes bacterium]|nr:hypothetical protein [Planctomycetota bacterium]
MNALPRCGLAQAALLVAFSLAVVASHAAAFTPEAVQAVAGETQVTLTWTHPEPVPYKVLRSEHQTYGFSTIGTTEALSFVDRGLPAGTFYYIIAAVEGVPAIEYRSATVSASPTDIPPPAPDPVTLRFSTNLWSLEWDLPSVPPDLAGFHVYQRRTPDESLARLEPQLLAAGTRRLIGDKPQNRIYVRLGSVDRAGHESFSIEKTITPGDFHKKHPNDKDPIPTGLTATGGETIVDLAWDPLPGACAFRVYRSTSSGSECVLLDTAYANSYRDTSVPAGTY